MRSEGGAKVRVEHAPQAGLEATGLGEVIKVGSIYSRVFQFDNFQNKFWQNPLRRFLY